jgi:hypothetical protein
MADTVQNYPFIKICWVLPEMEQMNRYMDEWADINKQDLKCSQPCSGINSFLSFLRIKKLRWVVQPQGY